MARTYLLRGHPKPANENEARDVDFGVRHLAFVDYEQRLERSEKQQVIALGRLGWPLWRIEQETGVGRETVGAYLKAAGIGVRPPGSWGRRPPAKPTGSLQHWLPGRRLWHRATESGARRAALS
jgi:hypothetical protein